MIKGTLNFFANITTFCLATRPVPQCPQGLNSNACGQMFLCPAGYEFSGLVGTSPIMQWIPSGRSFEHCLPFFQRVTAVVKFLQPPPTHREDSCSLNLPQILPVAGNSHVIQGVGFSYVSFVTMGGKREPMLKHLQFLAVLHLNYQYRGLQNSSQPVSSICVLILSESLEPFFYSLCIFLLNGFFMFLLLLRWLKGKFSWQHNLLFEGLYYCCLLKGFSILPGYSNLFQIFFFCFIKQRSFCCG